MPILEAINRRKLVQWMTGYCAAGFVVLEAVDQLIGNGILPAVTYRVVLAFYLFGIPGAGIMAWFHGEKGTQKPPKIEIWLQSAILVAAIVVSGVMIRDARREAAARESLLFSAGGGLAPDHVAVVYFEDLTSQGDLGYVADGFTESLIDQLDQVRQLDVVSANGVRPFRGTTVSRDSIARALAVGTLVAGAVERASGDRIVFSASLVDGGSGGTLERISVTLPSDQILAAQDSVADQVARAIRNRIGEEADIRLRRRATDVLEAWSGVQQAVRFQNEAEVLFDDGDLAEALATFERADGALVAAAEADPAWSEPVTLRAHNSFRIARVMLSQDRLDEADARLEDGIGYAGEALGREANDAKAFEARGNMLYLRYLWDLEPDPARAAEILQAARTDLEQAVRLDPGLASAHNSLSHMYYALDDNVNVVLSAQKAYDEDAYLRDADLILDRLFWGHYDLENFPEARRWCDEGYRRFPQNHRFTECHLWVMLAPNASRESPDSLVARARGLKARLDSVAAADLRQFEQALGTMLVGGVLALTGSFEEADTLMAGARLSPLEDPTLELTGFEAAIRSVIGDTGTAIRLLQQYVAANPHHSLARGGRLHWWWRNLRDEPGFQAVLETDH